MTNAIMAPPKNHNTTTTTAAAATTSSSPPRRVKFGQLLSCSSSEPNVLSPLLKTHDNYDEDEDVNRPSNASEFTTTATSRSPRLSFSGDENPTTAYAMSPWSETASPYINSPWIKLSPIPLPDNHHKSNIDNVYHSRGRNCLIGSLVREEGHVYSLAVMDGVLYTGSDSKNIRVWRDFHDSGGFKSGSGLVKAIVVSSNRGRVFTGHQDGKIRVWTQKGKRVGTLPKLSDFIKTSVNPKNYIEVRRHHKVLKIKHYDAVSCLGLNEDQSGLLYSGSWDKTIKVWRVKDGKCLESIDAHDDAINSVVVAFGGLVFSGSADGTVKVWRRELQGRTTRHFNVRTLLKQEYAVTSLAVAEGGAKAVLYCGSSDGLVNFWEREEEEVVYGGVLRGHKLAVLCLATAGCLVFSGSADKSICVWRREEEGDGGVHSCLAVLVGHSGPVKCLAVEQNQEDHETDHDNDGEGDQENQRRQWIVYSGSLDKSVRIWRVSEHAPADSI